MNKYQINDSLTVEDIIKLINSSSQLTWSDESRERVVNCRSYLDHKMAISDQPVYGINTGFGSLYNKFIPKKDLRKLQENLIMSHACGTGKPIPEEIVRLILILKIQSLSYGYSGVQLEVVDRLMDFYNLGIHPLVFEQGSLGASGDLAPLAHLSLPLIGMGEVSYHGKIVRSDELLKKLNWEPILLRPKDGLALLNGTQFMSAYGVWAVIQSKRLMKFANIIGALSLDAFDGRIDPFKDEVHRIRPHRGQIAVANVIRTLLQGSELIIQQKEHIQDPYSFRCIPQVHGATADTIDYFSGIIHTEINSVTDNPNIFIEGDSIISAGNFHGQPLALGFDFLGIAIAELGNISERRTFQLISGQRNLPHYLVANPGINSGLMIPQYTAASIVSQNKQLCTPASVDSIPSSNGQEDHVSMGANAATKTFKIINNVYTVLAIELLTAVQALNFRRPLNTSPQLEDLVSNFSKVVTFIDHDRILHEDIVSAVAFLKTSEIE
ncbi:MAG: histidine ammonia-lyase [Cyclobacteriaceae bacterium]|nr:histidine ammonia-lyase [Cyclobacteriaceae bacterium]